MPRSSTVSEKVWAQAIHAVTVQKMSLRRAAQLYGVHHMSLHRRVRGRYVSPATARFADEFQLSRAEENEAVSVLREQFEHEQRVTSDDVRYVVRTIACQNGQSDVPADFPQTRWIASFRRTHGFSTKSDSSSADVHAHHHHSQLARANSSSSNSSGNEGGVYGFRGHGAGSATTAAAAPSISSRMYDDDNDAAASARYSPSSSSNSSGSSSRNGGGGSIAELSHAASVAMSMRDATMNMRMSMSDSGLSDGGLSNPMYRVNHNSSSNNNNNNNNDSVNAWSTPRSMFTPRAYQPLASLALSDHRSTNDETRNDTSESESESSQRAPSKTRGRRVAAATSTMTASAGTGIEVGVGADNDDANEYEEAKQCQQRTTVSAETWERAMDAVEIHGMSLRNAAKAYGVHFAALHRRVKKRALQQQAAPPLENYIPFEDEAGVVRVVHARADLGIPLTYDELVDLLQRTALKHVPALSADFSRALVRRFQSRVEQSIRHLVCDWPLPRLDALCHFHASPVSANSDGSSITGAAAGVMGDTAMAMAVNDSKASVKVAPFAPSPSSSASSLSLYAREHDFPSEPRARLSASSPFVRPMYRTDAIASASSTSSSTNNSSNSSVRISSPSAILRL